ncbi:complex I NDUFA9 subunit family protein [Novosphingobium panipatense]|uniref:NADH dehydrogenase n=1 Tax=Novosphingobium panipatense TaxID=428991 RepID=A0ABY1Q6I2_9SPHN|nr:complex I NDUFA9 subunit family protein [Novosphingobium panipatense]SMP59694.1 NADH dehydrogenase [Novosphingobium panipatense]
MSTLDTLSGKIVTILGGSGFVGRHLAQELFARGARLRIAARHPRRAFSIRTLGNLGYAQFVSVDITKPQSLAAVFAGSDVVVNLVGAFSGNLDAVQGKGLNEVAAAAKAAGVAAFVHVSALGADAGSDVAYSRTKAEGEAAVRAGFPEATIIRPSLMFGPDDRFLNTFAELISRLPALPVLAAGARIQPVFVDDVAHAIANALCEAAARGRTFELAGPEVITMLELNQRIARAQGRSRKFIELSDGMAGAFVSATGWLPGAPITGDQFKLLRAGSVASGSAAGLEELGVTPRPLGLFLDRWMVRFRKHGRFGTKVANA